MPLVAGVDGCPAGWLIVRADSHGDNVFFLHAEVVPTFADVLALPLYCIAIAVDIPIGLSEGAPRQADLEARRVLRGPRASSVFPAPPRAVLAANDYVNACAISLSVSGKKLSKQAYNLLGKVRQADAALTPEQRRARECHPEVSFWALNDELAMAHNKKTPAGREERAALLSAAFQTEVRQWPTPRGAGRDDLYDAAVLAWTAARIARSKARSLPSEPPLDARGLRMEIVY